MKREARRRWISDRIAALREFGFGDTSRLVWSKRAGNEIVTVWYTHDKNARDRLAEQLDLPVVKELFDIDLIADRIAADDDEVIGAFLDD